MLLQIFSKTVIGPIFFEFIQRKGDEGFGEGNFRALFEFDRRGSNPPRRFEAGARSKLNARDAEAICRASAMNSRPKPCPAHCRSGRTRRSGVLTVSMPSNCPAPPSPRRAAPTSAPGSTASAHPSCTPAHFKRRRSILENGARLEEHERPLGQLRWGAVPIPDEKLSFIEGVRTMTTAGDVDTQTGMAAHIYLVTQSMVDDYFYNADGELLIVPQQGALTFFTEFGRIECHPARSASFRAA